MVAVVAGGTKVEGERTDRRRGDWANGMLVREDGYG